MNRPQPPHPLDQELRRGRTVADAPFVGEADDEPAEDKEKVDEQVRSSYQRIQEDEGRDRNVVQRYKKSAETSPAIECNEACLLPVDRFLLNVNLVRQSFRVGNARFRAEAIPSKSRASMGEREPGFGAP